MVFGFLIVIFAAFLFCFQNVIVRVLFTEHLVLGLFQTGGFVEPTLQNSFLLMFMRMLIVVPLMPGLLSRIYPSIWQEIGQLRQPQQRSLLLQAIGGGILMFLYLALLYVSIGLIPTGIALTLFFTYPVFTALFAWKWLGDRPTVLRWLVMILVFVGSYLTLPAFHSANQSYNIIGAIAGVASGITYALYTIVAQKSFQKLHPVPFTWISFTTTLVLSTLCLTIWYRPEPLPWWPLWMGGLLSAIVTFGGHVLNNIGIRLIGASTASMIAASNPAFTVVLAWLTIQERLNQLQLLGVGIVTLSVALLSQEHLLSKRDNLWRK